MKVSDANEAVKWWEMRIEIVGSGQGLVPDIVEGCWATLIDMLRQTAEVLDIPSAEGGAWFHLRRSTNWSKTGGSFHAKTEVLRLRQDWLGDKFEQDLKNEIKDAVQKCHGVLAEWGLPGNQGILEPTGDMEPYDPHFWSFLQKLSFLRAAAGLRPYPRCLRCPPDVSYARCCLCRKADKVMRNTPWVEPLSLWAEYTNERTLRGLMSEDRKFEYAHWFAHLLSEWAPPGVKYCPEYIPADGKICNQPLEMRSLAARGGQE